MQRNPLVGTWRLVSFDVQNNDGVVTHPFGPEPLGFITYTVDGYMAVQFGRRARPTLASDDWWAAPPAEIALVAQEYFAYCGTYELHEGEVVHHVEVSLMPNLVGKEQVRRVAIHGDTLTLSTPPTPVGGQLQVASLVWHRD